MTTSDFLGVFNVFWNLAQIAISIALLRIGWTIQHQIDEILQILREIRADMNGDTEPVVKQTVYDP